MVEQKKEVRMLGTVLGGLVISALFAGTALKCYGYFGLMKGGLESFLNKKAPDKID